MGESVINEPFCVINCDDFYNRDSFQVIGDFLSKIEPNQKNKYAMVGFRVCNTLSENGTVSRGVCDKGENGNLTQVIERTEIKRVNNDVCYRDGENWVKLDKNCPVSMNMWGFTPDYFEHSKKYFIDFLKDPKNLENLKSEFYIPTMVDYLINSGTSEVKVLDTNAKWFGVTYSEDRPSVMKRIKELVESGEYPNELFS